MNLTPRQFPSMETHPIRLQQQVFDWFFVHSGAFSRHSRFLHYASQGRKPRKAFELEVYEYLAWKA